MAEAEAFQGDFDLDQATGEPAFTVDLDGFEGPLDLLLELARRQKVDLARISILALAEQYLLFVEAARKLRLELAADYLVMAAWLAFLKSRLLLPAPSAGGGVDASELAERLAQRLRALEAIRKAAEYLMSRPRLGRDFFARGEPEAVETHGRVSYRRRSLRSARRLCPTGSEACPRAGAVQDARGLVARRRARGAGPADRRPVRLDGVRRFSSSRPAPTPECAAAPARPSFSASLELVREGKIEMRQEKTFAPIWIRPAGPDPAEGALRDRSSSRNFQQYVAIPGGRRRARRLRRLGIQGEARAWAG